jgi:hypothetical protein
MRIFVMVAASLLCGAMFASEAEAQPATLQCRGGGAMNVNVFSPAPAVTEIVVRFTRAPGTRTLPAGACAWMDQPLAAYEPISFLLVVNARVTIDLRLRPGDHASDRGDLLVVAGSGADAAYAQTIVSTLKAGGGFTVQADNGGQAPMVASSFTPGVASAVAPAR